MALPNVREQELLQLINRFRADPAGEAARISSGAGMTAGEKAAIGTALRYFRVDQVLFAQQLAVLSPAEPLAWNSMLEDAAAAHSAEMIAAKRQSHQLAGEAVLGARVTAAGFSPSAVGENVYAFASSAVYAHAGLVVDWGGGTGGMQTPAGHRSTLINAGFSEIGIDATANADAASSLGPLVVTQNLGQRLGYAAQLVGVVFDDGDGDGLFDAGEGRGGVTVSAAGGAGTFSTTSWGAGGYQLMVPAGSYTVTFSGGGMVGSYVVGAAMASRNVQVDAEAGQFSVPVPVPVPGPVKVPVASLSADRSVNEAVVRIIFTVTLDAVAAAPVSVRWGLGDGTATVADGDMPASQGGTVTIAAGQSSGIFTVLVNDEAHRAEGTESFSVVLDQPQGVALGRARAEVSLLDSYVAPPAVALAMTDIRTNTAGSPTMTKYGGPLNYLDQEFIYLGADGIALTANAPNVFLRSGSGDDALAVAGGQNVLDAGAGSNFLTGGSGADTFFLDARGAVSAIWNTVVDLAAGDAVTVWGVSQARARFAWEEGGGARGSTGLTLHATLDGGPTVSLTLRGLVDADRSNGRLAVLFGTDGGSGSDYMFVFANR